MNVIIAKQLCIFLDLLGSGNFQQYAKYAMESTFAMCSMMGLVFQIAAGLQSTAFMHKKQFMLNDGRIGCTRLQVRAWRERYPFFLLRVFLFYFNDAAKASSGSVHVLFLRYSLAALSL